MVPEKDLDEVDFDWRSLIRTITLLCCDTSISSTQNADSTVGILRTVRIGSAGVDIGERGRDEK